MIERLRRVDRLAWLLLFLRVGLGGLFITSSIAKFQYPDLFIDAVQGYGLLPNSLGEFFGTVLPWAELFIGWCLVLGIFLTFASAISIPLILSFVVANISSFFRDVGEACGCLGDLVNLSHTTSLIVDIGMLLVAGLVIYQRRRAGIVGIAGAVRVAAGKRQWLAIVLQVALVALLTGAIGGAIMAAGTKPTPELPVTEEPRVMYFWNGCHDCYGAEVDQVESLQTEYGDRVDFVEVDYLADPSALSEYGVTDDDFTVLLLTWQSETNLYCEYARFVGNLEAGTFSLTTIQNGLEALFNT